MDELRITARRAGDAQDRILVDVGKYKDGLLVSQKGIEIATYDPDQVQARALAELGKMTGVSIALRVLADLLDG